MGRKKADKAARLALGVHERIRQARENAGLTPEQMAGLLKVHELTYYRIESGLVGMTVERVAEIARFLRVKVGSLFGEGRAA